MSTLVTLFQVLVAIYRLILDLWNVCIVLLQVMQSMMQEARQESAELMALLDDGTPTMDAITPTSLLHDASDPANPWQILIIARASSFVLLVRLSKHRVLHLEVDESVITAKLEVIQSRLVLRIQHIPRLLQMSIGIYDTRLVRYTPMRLLYLWKEEQADPRCGGEDGIERSIVPAMHASSVSAGGEGRSHRKKYVQLLTESALRRRLHMDRVGRAGVDAVPKRGMGIVKNHGENVVKRKALANATNMDITHAEGSTADADGASDETYGLDTGVEDTPKQVRMERNIHAALSENLSIPNMVQAASSRKTVESVPQSRRMGGQSLRRKRGQFDLYAQGIPSEFSLVPKMGQGRD